MKYLGVDYGKRKVGLAVSEGISASSLSVLEISSLDDAITKILLVIHKEEIEKVIVGQAESGESRGMTEKFVRELEKWGVKVEVVEETLSSYLADEQLRAMNSKRKKLKKNDAMAAVIILEDYLARKDQIR